MQSFSTIAELRDALANSRQELLNIGLVPTMGNLHAGHLKLIAEAKQHCDVVVASIFVNPLQFGPAEDFDSYPRTLERDTELLSANGCDVVFAPPVEEIFGDQNQIEKQQATHIRAAEVSHGFCGASRPGHFDGVATIVAKLFNIVKPDLAFFGLKDYQQYLVINQLVTDLAIDVEIIGVDTVREENGLAMSSRNNYLTAEQKDQATVLVTALKQCKQSIRQGSEDFAKLEAAAIDQINATGLKVDYFSVCDASNLKSANSSTKELVILGAAYLGSTRLIDNVRLSR